MSDSPYLRKTYDTPPLKLETLNFSFFEEGNVAHSVASTRIQGTKKLRQDNIDDDPQVSMRRTDGRQSIASQAFQLNSAVSWFAYVGAGFPLPRKLMRDAHGGLTSSKDSACGASIPTKFLAVSALSSILFSRAVQSLSRPRDLRLK